MYTKQIYVPQFDFHRLYTIFIIGNLFFIVSPFVTNKFPCQIIFLEGFRRVLGCHLAQLATTRQSGTAGANTANFCPGVCCAFAKYLHRFFKNSRCATSPKRMHVRLRILPVRDVKLVNVWGLGSIFQKPYRKLSFDYNFFWI